MVGSRKGGIEVMHSICLPSLFFFLLFSISLFHSHLADVSVCGGSVGADAGPSVTHQHWGEKKGGEWRERRREGKGEKVRRREGRHTYMVRMVRGGVKGSGCHAGRNQGRVGQRKGEKRQEEGYRHV